MAIKKPNELNFENEKFNVLIAGYPGIGKSTLGLSAPKPLLINVDKGISRVNAKFRKDIADVDSYEELLNDLNTSDLSVYETIIIDTGGKLLDLMKDWAIRKDPKNGQSNGTLTQRGYGVVGKEFMDFVNSIKYKFKKHCVVIFHAKEEKDGDITKLRIDIEGQSKNNVWQPMDLGGFMEVVGKDRVIGFTNCERYFAKGTHGIHGVWKIENPEETGKNDFLTNLFDKMSTYLKEEAESAEKEKEEYLKVMEEVKSVIESMTPETIENVQEVIKNAKHVSTSDIELKNIFKKKLAEIGYKWDSQEKKYVSIKG